MGLDVTPIPVLSDNYAWLLRCGETGAQAVLDPGEAGAVLRGVTGEVGLILLTHHHVDHTGGVDVLRDRWGAKVAGPKSEAGRLPRLDIGLSDGDRVEVGVCSGVAMLTPGHADGHLSYYFERAGALFTGDALFSLGCGRLLEGTAAELYHSLHRFDALPDETRVYAGHEYTLGNARFALHVDPENQALRRRVAEVEALRARGVSTLPVTLGEERATNPFLRARDVAAFAALRAEKDRF